MEQNLHSQKPQPQKQAAPVRIKVKAKLAPQPEAQPITQLPPQAVAVEAQAPDFSVPEPSFAAETASARKPKPRKKWLLAVWIALGILAVAVLAILFLPRVIMPRDINNIHGCPELNDIAFGMSVEAVSEKLEVEHHTLEGLPSDGDDPMIAMKPETELALYGLPVQDFLCSFDERELVMVLLMFSKEAVTCEQLTELYGKIYGPAATEADAKIAWIGKTTTITLFTESDADAFVVRYKESPNQDFGKLTFRGTELDPCGFLEDHYAFDKSASYYVADLKEGKDYTVEQFSDVGFGGFTEYTLYPDYTFMGIEEGYTAISLSVDASERTVGVTSYLFRLDRQNAADKFDFIKQRLNAAYGTPVDCSYTSLRYSDMGVQELAYTQLKAKIQAGTQGIYHIQWNDGRYRVTLGLTIEQGSTLYDGNVAYSPVPPHTHDYALQKETAPACTKDGEKLYACDCGDSYTEAIKATGHSFSGPTCVEPAICAFCGAASETIGSHTYTAKVTAPTCSAQGYTTYTCFCGDSYEDDRTATVPHTYENYKCTVCGAVDKANATKYLEWWLKENGEYDSSVPYYYYLDPYESDVLCYSLSFSISGNTLFIDRANIEQGVMGYTILAFSDGSYRTEFGNHCIKGSISKFSFTRSTPVSHTSFNGQEEALSLMSDLARASIVDTLDWLARFLAAHNVGITLADLGFVSYR